MKILGLKLTHDGSYTVMESNRLRVTFELEKHKNNNRFKILNSLDDLNEILEIEGYSLKDFDKIIVDGWISDSISLFQLNENKHFNIRVAPYIESELFKDVSKELIFNDLIYENKSFEYSTFSHVTGHILSSYMTSSFAKKKENSYVLIWDGGMYPRLYFIDAESFKILPLGHLFCLGVNIYSIFSQHFGPFKINDNVIKDELSIAGKVMAYVAFGNFDNDINSDLELVYNNLVVNSDFEISVPLLPYDFAREFIKVSKDKDYLHEDVLTTFHHFLGNLLLKKLQNKIAIDGKRTMNLCYGGGAALNIKWNSLIRNNLKMNLWISPFPNDSGSSIGAACSELFINSKVTYIDWNVYSGPLIKIGDIDKFMNNGWSVKEICLEQLAEILHKENEPILFLHSRAEIGPRALGNRSILFSATCLKNKDIINKLKLREHFRPVAPICIEERASEVFDPGCEDPYMLFEHSVRDLWISKIPAAMHEDNSSRLQTVNIQQNAILYQLLSEYERQSQIPVLLNTSANFKGSGFFPDVYSALKWGKVKYIWCDNKLYFKKDK